MGRTPSSSASSTISTARSTPKQKPYSSASRTSMLLSCRRGSLPALLAPLLSQLVAAGDPVVNPFHFPLERGCELGQHSLLQARERVCDVFRKNCVRTIT